MTVAHPAKFSAPILGVLRELVPPGAKVLDPFAGVGLVHSLDHAETWGVEIEPEWATVHPRTIVGDALSLPFPDASFDVVVTSPTYGNRMADHHNAKDGSRRITYRHTLGRPLHPNNSGQLQWGAKYREFHERAWAEVRRVLRPGGRFLLNVSNHIRKGEEQPVAEWHRDTLRAMGFWFVWAVPIETPRMRFGENHQARITHEHVLSMFWPGHENEAAA